MKYECRTYDIVKTNKGDNMRQREHSERQSMKNCSMIKIATLVVLLAGTVHVGIGQTTFSISTTGTILKNGQPWFPMGFYIDRSTVASYTSQVNAIAAAGAFNVINLPYGSGDWNVFLNLCSSKGIYVVSQLDYSGDFTAAVNTYKGHAAMYAWSVADDADNGYFTTTQLRDRNTQVKNADANHPTETSLTGYYLGRRQAADNYTSIADVACYQCYPITPPANYDVTAANALTETYLRTLTYVKSSEKVHRPMIMNTQYFSWGGQSPNPRYPTAAEVRNMTYSGLAAGIKGIIAYTYSANLTSQIEEWAEIKALRADVTRLEGALLGGTLTRLTTGDQEVVVSLWDYRDTAFIVAINTSYSATKTLNQTIPGTHSGPAQAVFARFPTGLIFTNNRLAGQIQPQGVHMYKLMKSGGTGIGSSDQIRGSAIGKYGENTGLYYSLNGRKLTPASGDAKNLFLQVVIRHGKVNGRQTFDKFIYK